MNLENVYQPVIKDLDRVMNSIKQVLKTDNPVISGAINHLFLKPGKFLRPAMTVLSGKTASALSEPVNENLVKLAASIELIHTASIIHDDIIDEAKTRRHKEAVHLVWGKNIALLVGDYFYSRAFGLLAQIGNNELVKNISRAADIMCEGEIREIENSFFAGTPEKEYIEIIKRKTAVLFCACCECGAVLSGGSSADIAALRNYGLNFGFAYQIIDDCTDLVGDEKYSGKTLRQDMNKYKLTLPIIYFLRNFKEVPKDKYRLYELWNANPSLSGKAIEDSFAKSGEYLEISRAAVQSVNDSVYKNSICGLLDYLGKTRKNPAVLSQNVRG